MLAVAVSLLVLDGLTTACLIVRRRRLRQRQMIRASVAPDAIAAARRANDDLARRQALLRAQRVAHPSIPVVNGRGAGRQVPAGPRDELRRSADVLAALPKLVYDPMIWET